MAHIAAHFGRRCAAPRYITREMCRYTTHPEGRWRIRRHMFGRFVGRLTSWHKRSLWVSSCRSEGGRGRGRGGSPPHRPHRNFGVVAVTMTALDVARAAARRGPGGGNRRCVRWHGSERRRLAADPLARTVDSRRRRVQHRLGNKSGPAETSRTGTWSRSRLYAWTGSYLELFSAWTSVSGC
jgi:hypothetical protein